MTGPADDVTLTFGGNATMLLRIGPFTLLTDPNFLHRGQRAYLGYGLRAKRLTDPYERFRDTREEDLDYAAVVEAGANVLRACGDHGWEPPEG